MHKPLRPSCPGISKYVVWERYFTAMMQHLLMLNRIPFFSFLHCFKVPCCEPQWAILQKREVQWIPWWRLGLVYMARDVVLTEILSHENQGSILYRQWEWRWWEQSGQLKLAALEREKEWCKLIASALLLPIAKPALDGWSCTCFCYLKLTAELFEHSQTTFK